jgi:HK97 family phage major capsid protein
MKPKKFPGKPDDIRSFEAPIRALAPTSAEDGGDGVKRFEIAVSSEYPVKRFSWMTDEAYREVLSHAPGAIDLKRFQSGSAPVLVDHETRDQVGVIESSAVGADNVLRAVIRFSQSVRGQEIQRDVEDGIRKNISVGYAPDPRAWQLVEASSELGDLWRSTSWEPLEASIVPIPADPTVGVGRAKETAIAPSFKEGRKMKKWVFDMASKRAIEVDETDERTALAPELVEHLVESRSSNGAAPAPKRDRDAEIAEIAATVKANEKLGVTFDPSWLERKLTPAQVNAEILAKVSAGGYRTQPAEEQVAGAYKARDLAGYSLANVVRMAAGMVGNRDGFGLNVGGIEGEVDGAIRKSLPAGIKSNGGMFMPMRLFPRGTRTAASSHASDMASGLAGVGSELIFDRPGELIEFWRNASTFLQAGAINMPGLVGPISFPKKTGGMTFSWVAEGASPASSAVTLGLVTMTPKSLRGFTEYPRELLQQAPSAGVDLENMIRQDAGEGIALAGDLAGYHGNGAAGEPMGIFNAADVLTVTGMAASRAKLLEFESKLAAQNVPAGRRVFVTTPETASTFKSTVNITNAAAGFLWDGPVDASGKANILGYDAYATNQISKTLGGGTAHGIVYGNFRDALFGGWGVIEVVVNPYSLDTSGQIRVSFFLMQDVVIRHGQSFCTSNI